MNQLCLFWDLRSMLAASLIVIFRLFCAGLSMRLAAL